MNNLGDGLLPFQSEPNSKYGYIDINGNIVIQPQYSIALPFNKERAVVNTSADISNKYGLIDTEGNFIIEPIYNNINTIGEDRVAVGVAINPEEPYIGSNTLSPIWLMVTFLQILFTPIFLIMTKAISQYQMIATPSS